MAPPPQPLLSLEMLVINVVPYDSAWPEHFEQIRSQLAHALVDFLPLDRFTIEHVGSTSIPGLAAKPIIDIDIIVAAQDVMEATMALTSNGYTYAYEANGIDRMVFRYNKHRLDSGASTATEDGTPRRAVYLNKPDGAALANHLAVRRVLLSDPGLVQEYGDLKLDLARKQYDHIGSYGSAKSAVLRRILAQSGLSAAELDRIYNSPSRRVDAEIAAAKKAEAARAASETVGS